MRNFLSLVLATQQKKADSIQRWRLAWLLEWGAQKNKWDLQPFLSFFLNSLNVQGITHQTRTYNWISFYKLNIPGSPGPVL